MDSKDSLRKACDLCYTRKIKCDGQEPRCSNCVMHARECTHAAASRRKAKPRAQRHSATQRAGSLRVETNELKGSGGITREAQLPNQQPAHDHDHAMSSMKLPTLHEAMAQVGIFLKTVNSVLPLFHADSLLRMVGKCYALLPRQRDPNVCAAINIVFALASQHMPHSSAIEGVLHHQSEHTTTEYLNKAQSVLATVMQGEIRLLNIQTLVGMVVVLQTARDTAPALMLLSATMRLRNLDLAQQRQRARVFWITYILDKDLSLRAQIPSSHLDDDIDLELPSSVPVTPDDSDNSAGIVMTADGRASMNYFLVRVKLANIEGQTYRYLYSTRALNQSPQDRIMVRQSISIALDGWRASIPLEFGAAAVTMTASNQPANWSFFCILHSSSLQCMMLLNRAQAWDEQWVLVHETRDFVRLFQEVWSRDCWLGWIAACPYSSAAMLLMVNNLYNIRHTDLHLDIELVDAVMVWLDEISAEMASEGMKWFQDICAQGVRTVKRKCAVYGLI
ncbi:uncharacterized protein BO97DRAFT_469981 [Aspergillus homomorphus CBS 101889]|uniref:Zn(2)-C6 fungal-type domain-containing protein n=1 Tax=Aspergillus homomorphus (strain CBS 101889) TaxID=1450537 RepID=A0A395HZE1_ASPHC|nr:hypothetical protein BO97DRAFT_469981 [Aspergillus homomorphus CBS 101889]RAL13291.1 hypothetical protein BO97DRAFT_469981 [Aspergillus homomorphus CBS 101889]